MLPRVALLNFHDFRSKYQNFTTRNEVWERVYIKNCPENAEHSKRGGFRIDASKFIHPETVPSPEYHSFTGGESERAIGFEKEYALIHGILSVFPAQAGIQNCEKITFKYWIPAYAGTTEKTLRIGVIWYKA